MRKVIKFRDNMEALASDENTLQAHVQEYNDDLVRDFLQAPGERGYAGLAVTRQTSTTVRVAPGRYYDGSGRMHGLDAAAVIDLAPYLPTTSPRICAIVVYGQTNDAENVIRDFIDPATEEAVPRQVSLESQRQVMLSVVAGNEAASPVNPAISATYLGVAYVRLTPAGIAATGAITMITANEISSLDDAFARLAALEAARKRTDASIGSLRTEIGDLMQRIKGLADMTAIQTLAKEVALLREEIGKPDLYTSSHADNYMIASESWTAHPNWLAKVEEGIRFADANAAEQPIALLSSIDPNVMLSPGGLMLPKYQSVISVSIGDWLIERDAELPFAQYQTLTITGDALTLSRLRQRYGEDYVVCSNARYWQTGNYDPATGIFRRGDETWTVGEGDISRNHQYIRTTRYFEDDWLEAYWRSAATDMSVTGKCLCQTRFASKTRWVTGYDFMFTRVANAGDVTLVVCAVKDGRPDVTSILASVTVPCANLKQGGWTHFPLEPFAMIAGARYAMILVTSGDHWVQISNTNDFSQGTLFSFVDGDFAIAAPEKDLCFQEYVAQFSATRTVVDLQPWNLDGGITGIDLMAPAWRSKACTLTWQYKVPGSNTWTTIGETTGATPFIGLPPLVQARVVMTHTNDMAPAVKLPTSRVRLTRPRTNGVAISNPFATPAPITSVSLTILLSAYDPAYHTLVPKLRRGAGYTTVISATSVSTKTRPDGRVVMTATFTGLPATSAYCWQFEFTTSSALKPFVIEEVVDATQ